MEEMGQYARWIVTGTVAVGVIVLISLAAISYTSASREKASEQSWDEVYKATQGKAKPEDQIPALESVASKVQGTPTHAYVLMELANLQFKEALNPTRSKEDQAAALKKSEDLFKLVADQYNNNRTFSLLALQGQANIFEQKQDYDGGIKFLEDNLKKFESHYLYNQISTQLGRLYWLRSLKQEKAEDREKDREAARQRLADVLRQSTPGERGSWHEQAEYIRSLVDKSGKALPDGKAPPAKTPAESKDSARQMFENLKPGATTGTDVINAIKNATDKKNETKSEPAKNAETK